MPRISSATYRLILARRAPAPPADPLLCARLPEPEAALHRGILEHARSRGWIALHGSMAYQTHRTIGEPDFMILADRGRVLLVEAKRPGSKLSCEQAALHAWAKRLGHTVHVVRTLAEFVGLSAPAPESVPADGRSPTPGAAAASGVLGEGRS